MLNGYGLDSYGLKSYGGVEPTVPYPDGWAVVGTSALSSDLTVTNPDIFWSLPGGPAESMIRGRFSSELRIDGLMDVASYRFGTRDGYPVTPQAITLSFQDKGQGTLQTVQEDIVESATPFPSSLEVGDYLTLQGGASSRDQFNHGLYRVEEVLSATRVRLDTALLPSTTCGWKLTSAVKGVTIKLSKATNGAHYWTEVHAKVKGSTGAVTLRGSWVGRAEKPRLTQVESSTDDQIVLTFGESMRLDPDLVRLSEYTVDFVTPQSGRPPKVVGATLISERQLALKLFGTTEQPYRLTVNASGTPHDLAGNPINPTFNTAVFAAPASLTARSVFTDKGPIARPPLTLLQGTSASLLSFTTVQVSSGGLSSSLVGKYLRVTGTGKNDGEYFITAVLASNRLQVQADFQLPDVTATSWEVFDPRNGQIADDPSHVRVRVNGTPVVPEAVIGLLGQVVLPTAPSPSDQVDIDYSWVRNPTVDCVRLNSKEFKFNNWNRDNGRPNVSAGHKYRYNNVLLEPATYKPSVTIQQGTGLTVVSAGQVTLTDASALESFVGLTLALTSSLGITTHHRIQQVAAGNTLEVLPASLTGPYSAWSILDQESVNRPTLEQPQSRELHYRAYERAYTPVLNDPNLLVLNSPIHRIAYPPLERKVAAKFVSYAPTSLPENNPVSPWERVGLGVTTLANNQLTVQGTSNGVFPNGEPIFWRQPLDQTFPHAFAFAWRVQVSSVSAYEGVWSGLGAGYSTDQRVAFVGYVEIDGVKKFGFLRKGYGNDPGNPDAWTGGIGEDGNSTLAPANLDWSALHNYRVYRSKDGVIRMYLDGEVVETLRVYEDDLPYLEELATPFNELQQVFWGSISRRVLNKSVWDFVRYQVLPLNPYQTAPSIFVDYEASKIPEEDRSPWTPVGYHGYEVTQPPEYLLLNSTSATDEATELKVGLIGGDFRGFVRPEPLLAVSSDVRLEAYFQGLTHTHDISPNAQMIAIDDGDRLTQLSFLSDKASPKLSYGGRSLPTEWTPTPWSAMGSASVAMKGRILSITDTSDTSGLLYYTDDTALMGSPLRVFEGAASYVLEFRCQVMSYIPDGLGFVGATADIYDGTRTLGVMLQEVAGVKKVALHSDGSVKSNFDFDWLDGEPHTYRMVKSDTEVSLYVDALFVGSIPYATFDAPAGGTLVGVLSFGSATPISGAARSVVEWHYTNAWRTLTDRKFYMGIWKGSDPHSLTGYHLPLKVQGINATLTHNILTPLEPLGPSVVVGDVVVIDSGPNKGTYPITQVYANAVGVDRPFPLPTTDSFRIPQETDWTSPHRYRVVRNPAGFIGVTLDADADPILKVSYNHIELPSSQVGVPWIISGGLPSITWGAFDPTNLSSSLWNYVRYGITRQPTELRIVPHHQVMNQRNVVASPEHLRTNVPHSHTDFTSSSTGIPPQTTPDVFRNPALIAYTELNEGTPLVPLTQTAEVRKPTPYREFISAFNRVEDVLNRDSDFKLNDISTRWRLLVPPDVLYDSLDVFEQSTGQQGLLAPFDDTDQPVHLGLKWQNEACLVYDGYELPENTTGQPTPWVLDADNLAHVHVGSAANVLTFGTDNLGTRAIYRNATPLPDSPSLSTRITFRMKVVQDGTFGLGDSQIRLGFSSIGMTLALAFQTLPSGQRIVAVMDLNSGMTLNGIAFDFLDGAFHTYQIVRNPGMNTVTVTVVS